jgi:type II secretory pathway component GspD/PulD (secretin)
LQPAAFAFGLCELSVNKILLLPPVQQMKRAAPEVGPVVAPHAGYGVASSAPRLFPLASRVLLCLCGAIFFCPPWATAQSPEATSAQSAPAPALPDPPLPDLPAAAPPLPPSPLPTAAPSPDPTAAPAPSPSPSPIPVAVATPPPPPGPTPRNEPVVILGSPIQTPRTDYGPEGNRKAAQLRTQPPESFTFDRALLRDVLYFLADAAGIPFVSIPENAPQALQLVTFRMTASPFLALESLLKQNDLKLAFESGVWVVKQQFDFVPLRDEREKAIRQKQEENELVGVMYQLRYDSADRVDFRNELLKPQTAQSQAVPEGVTTPNLPLQNSQMVFAQRIPRVVNDIRAIVGLPPLRIDENGNLIQDSQGGAILDADQRLLDIQREKEALQKAKEQEMSKQFEKSVTTSVGGQTTVAEGVPGSGGGTAQQGMSLKESPGTESGGSVGLFQPGSIAPLYMPPEKPQVIYNSDQNFLWVVATRKQHRWVAEYLTKVDKPQTLIAIEVKFLETKKNPQTDIGINWQNTFGTGLTIGGQASIGGENIGSFGYTNGFVNQRRNNQQIGFGQAENVIFTNSDGSISTVTKPGSPPFANSIINDVTTSAQIASGSIPYSAVLSLDQFSVTLQAFMQDRDTSVVQYPRVLTLNNREVAITSSENTPLNIGTDTAVSATGTAGTTVGQLGYLPTGTQINILPKLVNANQIAMTVAITVSTIVGELPINLGTGVNLYPITSERVYNAALQVDSGFTLAVGGLEKVDDSNFEGGIPVLKDIPGVGYLFKNKNKKRNKVNLIIFITPYLIGDPAKTPGIAETPKSIVPLRPGLPPEAPTFTPDGKLAGGAAAASSAIAWLEFQLQYFRQVNLEAMMTADSVRKLRDVIGVARALVADLQPTAGLPPYDPDTTAGGNALRAEELLAELNRALAYAQDNLM